jgi:hypothetical protein
MHKVLLKVQTPNFMKILPVGAEVFNADEQTDGQTEGQTDMTKALY